MAQLFGSVATSLCDTKGLQWWLFDWMLKCLQTEKTINIIKKKVQEEDFGNTVHPLYGEILILILTT